jgi:hypothetical protein
MKAFALSWRQREDFAWASGRLNCARSNGIKSNKNRTMREALLCGKLRARSAQAQRSAALNILTPE